MSKLSKRKKAKRRFKKLVARRDRFYEKHNLAIPENVTLCERAVQRAIEKRGHRVYSRDRDRCDRFLKKLFRKYFIRKTTTERFWYLMLTNRLIGPQPQNFIDKTVVKRPEKSSKKFRKHKHGKRRKVK